MIKTRNIQCKGFLLFMAVCFSLITAAGQSHSLKGIVGNKRGFVNDFCLFSGDQLADIVVDSNDNRTVKLAAGLFCDDIERVTGLRPELKDNINSASRNCVIIGSIKESRIIKQFIRENKISAGEIQGQWESCLVQVVDHPSGNIEKALVIAGSDRRGTAYGIFEISTQIGVSPWYYFADVPVKEKSEIYVRKGISVLGSPSVKYRGIFINDEMWGIRPWAMCTHSPEEGKGLGPETYARIFELLLRLKANTLWPAMHQQTKPFNLYDDNKIVADKYGIVMGSSHIEPMLRNNIAGAEWDHEYPGEPWDYVNNRDHIYEYWRKGVMINGEYENIYTIGKRGKDDEAGTDITVPVLEEIFDDQREILKKYVNRDITKVPQVLIPYTEVLDLYNKGLKVPDDVIICWPDDNFGNIRQLPDIKEQNRSGGSGVYYHFQWLNGATTAYPWLYTTPLALTWFEMKKAYDHNVRELWIVNVGDIKPAEVGIEHFMQMAWDITKFEENNPEAFIKEWVERDFGHEYSSEIADVLGKHLELGYARRPENMVMFDGKRKELKWDWFSVRNYNDEVQKRIDDYSELIKKVDSIYESMPENLKDAFFQMLVYNVKGAALHNLKVLYAQKSNEYGKESRASALKYAALAQDAENGINDLIHHYNKELVTVGAKWDRMASLPGPWGGQWHQWDMPPVSTYSGEGEPRMNLSLEGGDSEALPGFSVFNRDKRYIDLYNTGSGVVYWKTEDLDEWIELSETSGRIYDEKRIWVTIDWGKAPKGIDVEGSINFRWRSSIDDEWRSYENLSESDQAAYRDGSLSNRGSNSIIKVKCLLFNPEEPDVSDVKGFVESNGYISIEAENYSMKVDKNNAGWSVIEGLGRTGNSVTVLPVKISAIESVDEIVENSPSLEYKIYTFTEGSAEIDLNCIPSYPINKEYSLRIAIAIDNEKPQIVSMGEKRDVMCNMLKMNTLLHLGRAGQHTLKIWMVDPGLVIDKIIIGTGGVRESYLGPPETKYY